MVREASVRTVMVGDCAVEVEEGSGNVFADIGLPDPEDHLVKAELALLIARAIEARGLSEEEAAALAGIGEPDLSGMVSGRLAKCSIETLIRCLEALGSDVEIVEKQLEPTRPGRLSVVAA